MENNISFNSNIISEIDISEVDLVLSSRALKAVFIFLYCVIFVLGVSGNSLVVYVVLMKKAMRTATNIFIASLAVSDIMLCLLAVPVTPLTYFTRTWVFGEFLCHFVPMSLCVCVYVSTYTSTAIAIDRYIGIVHPLKPRMSVSLCCKIIVGIWIFAFIASLPLGIFQELWIDETDGSIFCGEWWPEKNVREIFTLNSLFLQYIVPAGVITFSYSNIWQLLQLRMRSLGRLGRMSREREEIEIKRNKRMNAMLIAVVTVFVVCWLPLNALLLSEEYVPGFRYHRLNSVIFFSSHVIAMSSTVYNPFIYALMNTNFKNEFKSVIPCLFHEQRDTRSNEQPIVMQQL